MTMYILHIMYVDVCMYIISLSMRYTSGLALISHRLVLSINNLQLHIHLQCTLFHLMFYYLCLFIVQLRNSMLGEGSKTRPRSPAKQTQKVINKKSMKVTPTKKLQHMPGKHKLQSKDTDWLNRKDTFKVISLL